MDWLVCIRRAVNYMEENLLTVKGTEEISRYSGVSAMYLQKGFQIMTGFSLGEYIRNRRLYQSALELCQKDSKVTDIAFKYGYDTSESFSKAFTRFHNATPSQIKKDSHLIKTFLPLKIHIVIQGGNKMDYTIETIETFKLIGFERTFNFENSYEKIPEFWSEIFSKYQSKLFSGKNPENEIKKAVIENRIGEFGVCIDDVSDGKSFRYLIAGRYFGGEVPQGMKVVELPKAKWAKFNCIGPLPQSLQTVNTQIWNEWLPGNTEWELSGKYNIEWYSSEKTDSPDYRSEIWIPVVEKK